MGIPLFFKIISEKYDETIIDTENLNNIESLFIDMNCLIHPCCSNVLDDDYTHAKKKIYEKKMLFEIENYLKKIIEITKPKFLFIAIDGVAPCSKMNQQRLRRFKTILEKKEINKIKEKLEMPINNEFWDKNCISPGTKFMEHITKHIKHLLINDNIFYNIKTIFSDCLEPGEGEHKILYYIKNNKLDNNTVIYGLDADLIMLGLISGQNNVYLLREALEFGKPTSDFLYLDIDILKCNLIEDFKERYLIRNSNGILDNKMLINIIYDYVFICFFLGNDFLPHILGLDLRYEGLDIILDSYVDIYTFLNEPIINDKKINHEFLGAFLKKLSSNEDKFINALFKKRLKYSKFFKISETDEFERQKALLNNYPILNMNEEKYIINDNLYIKDWKKRYYLKAFNTYDENDIDNICKNYVNGVLWTFKYYMAEIPSWHWKYNYNHAPLLSDISKYINNIENINKIKFAKSKPVTPIVQLLSILPPESKDLVPKKYQTIFTYSNIDYLYPKEYKLDILFKRYYWMCQPILPYLDIKKVIQEVKEMK